ncbi:hypothetical protein Tco_0362672 [Tanacetum coccineum]
MEDEHLDTIPATESDKVIKSSVEDLISILSESNGISDGVCDVPLCDNPTPLEVTKDHSEIVVDSNNDDTSSDDDSYKNIKYVSLEERSYGRDEKWQSTTHANNSFPEYDSFLFEGEPDQGGLTSVVISDNSNDPFLKLPEFESFHFNPSSPLPPPEPLDIEISLIIKTDAPMINNFDELNEDEYFDPVGGEINVEVDDSFTFVIRTFLPYLTYPEVSPLLFSTKNEDTIFDPGIST